MRSLMRPFFISTALIFSGILAGCSYLSDGDQAPVSSIQALGSSAYTVNQGDTIEGVADGFGVTVGQLALWNHLNPPYNLTIGQKLWVKKPSSNNSENYFSQSPVRSEHEKQGPLLQTMEPGIVLPSSYQGQPKIQPKTQPITQASPANPITSQSPDINLPQISPSGWIWPMQGHVSSDPDGGIDIETHEHPNVVAAKAGKVIYVGPDANGDGKMIIIDHGQDWLSAYGNLESIRVKEGAVLARADSVGRVKDVLHFEIRQSGDSVDVSKYLPSA